MRKRSCPFVLMAQSGKVLRLIVAQDIGEEIGRNENSVRLAHIASWGGFEDLLIPAEVALRPIEEPPQ
jgi:hypothetical protein